MIILNNINSIFQIVSMINTNWNKKIERLKSCENKL
jgi:hypothetical protein